MRPEREEKFKKAISKKQGNLAMILEDVHDPHNISAVLRSCDAVGVQEVYIVDSFAKDSMKFGKKSSASASKWLDFHFYDKIEDCISEVKLRYDKVLSTHLGAESVSLYDCDLTASVALLFGNEKDGVSQKGLELSDGNFIIPQVGLIQSLNISVACAISLYEAYRQREIAGMYDSPVLSQDAQTALFNDWCRR